MKPVKLVPVLLYWLESILGYLFDLLFGLKFGPGYVSWLKKWPGLGLLLGF